jgi:hypothetical protein
MSLVVKHPVFHQIVQKLRSGKNVMLIDVDGPDIDTYPQGIAITRDVLEEKLNDPARPFGHGYAAAWALLDVLDGRPTMPKGWAESQQAC